MKLKTTLLAVMLTCAGMHGAWAQQQDTCKLACVLETPADGAVIHPLETYHVKVAIRNSGPDGLEVGDTLYYNTSTMPASATVPYVLTQAIPASSSVTLTLTSVVNEVPSDVTMEYCVKVVSKPSNDGSFIDPYLDNNIYCNTVTFMGAGTSDINGAVGSAYGLTLFPNPAEGDELSLATGNNISGVATVTIYDMMGRAFSRKVFEPVATGTENLKLDISKLAPGNYFVEMQQKNGRYSGRFVKK